jgi:AraC-like DNA-binding protein
MVASGRLGLRPEIQRVIEDLHAHLAEPYDLTRAASVAALHPNYFSALFRSEIGQTFSEYVGRLRMELAARYLQEGVWSIQQIAEMVGIANYRTFYNTFRRFMGVNPSEFTNCVDSIPQT